MLPEPAPAPMPASWSRDVLRAYAVFGFAPPPAPTEFGFFGKLSKAARSDISKEAYESGEFIKDPNTGRWTEKRADLDLPSPGDKSGDETKDAADVAVQEVANQPLSSDPTKRLIGYEAWQKEYAAWFGRYYGLKDFPERQAVMPQTPEEVDRWVKMHDEWMDNYRKWYDANIHHWQPKDPDKAPEPAVDPQRKPTPPGKPTAVVHDPPKPAPAPGRSPGRQPGGGRVPIRPGPAVAPGRPGGQGRRPQPGEPGWTPITPGLLPLDDPRHPSNRYPRPGNGGQQWDHPDKRPGDGRPFNPMETAWVDENGVVRPGKPPGKPLPKGPGGPRRPSPDWRPKEPMVIDDIIYLPDGRIIEPGDPDYPEPGSGVKPGGGGTKPPGDGRAPIHPGVPGWRPKPQGWDIDLNLPGGDVTPQVFGPKPKPKPKPKPLRWDPVKPHPGVDPSADELPGVPLSDNPTQEERKIRDEALAAHRAWKSERDAYERYLEEMKRHTYYINNPSELKKFNDARWEKLQKEDPYRDHPLYSPSTEHAQAKKNANAANRTAGTRRQEFRVAMEKLAEQQGIPVEDRWWRDGWDAELMEKGLKKAGVKEEKPAKPEESERPPELLRGQKEKTR